MASQRQIWIAESGWWHYGQILGRLQNGFLGQNYFLCHGLAFFWFLKGGMCCSAADRTELMAPRPVLLEMSVQEGWTPCLRIPPGYSANPVYP